jgi:hypothetical protein
MHLSPSELKYIKQVLECTDTLANAVDQTKVEQIDFQSVNHKNLVNKIQTEINRVHWK